MRRQGCETQSFLHSPAAGAPPNSLSLGFSRFANAPRTPLRPEAANAMLNPQWELPTRADHPLAPKVEPPAALLERAGVPPAVSLLPRGLSEIDGTHAEAAPARERKTSPVPSRAPGQQAGCLLSLIGRPKNKVRRRSAAALSAGAAATPFGGTSLVPLKVRESLQSALGGWQQVPLSLPMPLSLAPSSYSSRLKAAAKAAIAAAEAGSSTRYHLDNAVLLLQLAFDLQQGSVLLPTLHIAASEKSPAALQPCGALLCSSSRCGCRAFTTSAAVGAAAAPHMGAPPDIQVCESCCCCCAYASSTEVVLARLPVIAPEELQQLHAAAVQLYGDRAGPPLWQQQLQFSRESARQSGPLPQLQRSQHQVANSAQTLGGGEAREKRSEQPEHKHKQQQRKGPTGSSGHHYHHQRRHFIENPRRNPAAPAANSAAAAATCGERAGGRHRKKPSKSRRTPPAAETQARCNRIPAAVPEQAAATRHAVSAAASSRRKAFRGLCAALGFMAGALLQEKATTSAPGAATGSSKDGKPESDSCRSSKGATSGCPRNAAASCKPDALRADSSSSSSTLELPTMVARPSRSIPGTDQRCSKESLRGPRGPPGVSGAEGPSWAPGGLPTPEGAAL
ncbi:uncharacterized protein LOC34623812 [Cyclospora cayetanensis]|uniref:Uncharacterized protein LOC34623812 n=1 Tax=Cyclospora cayetanensis TaxID=88456 RepID=A0A6P6RZZ7_9EIME|nr:uncharacterized protein LOC34623812 [Cyclospora cayetanensis]